MMRIFGIDIEQCREFLFFDTNFPVISIASYEIDKKTYKNKNQVTPNTQSQ